MRSQLRSLVYRLPLIRAVLARLAALETHSAELQARFTALQVTSADLQAQVAALQAVLKGSQPQAPQQTGLLSANTSTDSPNKAFLSATAVAKFNQMYNPILDPQVDDNTLGFRRDQMPCLININGDLLWLPADLLKFLWHPRLPDASSVIPHFLAETPDYAWIRERLRPGDVVLDVGANIGLFTAMMATKVGVTGSVHAFEPSPVSCSSLRRILRLNKKIHWVVVNECTLSDTCGETLFCNVLERDVQREASHLSTLEHSEMLGAINKNNVLVQTTTLDAYVEQKRIIPRLIKIGAGRAEFLILEGGRKCIEWFKPLLVIKVHLDEGGVFDHERLKRYLDDYDYTYSYEGKAYFCT